MEPLVAIQLITNEISVKNNHLPAGSFDFSPTFYRKIGEIDKAHMFVELSVEIISTKEKPFPVDIRASMTGTFDISDLKEEDVEDYMKIQSVQTMLPHLRSLISTTMAGALMAPLMLPLYDVRMLFPDEK